jgi:hypothetical protein
LSNLAYKTQLHYKFHENRALYSVKQHYFMIPKINEEKKKKKKKVYVQVTAATSAVKRPTSFLDSNKDKSKQKRVKAPGEDRTRDLSLTKRTHYHYATEAS